MCLTNGKDRDCIYSNDAQIKKLTETFLKRFIHIYIFPIVQKIQVNIEILRQNTY